MSEAATPAATPNDGTPSGTPPTPPAATPATPQTETVTLKKEEVDQLKRDAARASANQSKADRYDRLVGSGRVSGFKPSAPAAPQTDEEKEEAAAAEDRKAEKGLMGLALDPAYREVVDSDPTLRSLLTQNPLSVLPMYAPDALDAEDAISLVKEKLSARAAEIKAKGTPPAPANPPAAPATPPAAPPAGGVNPPGATTPDADYEAARKLPNTEQAIAGMVKQGLKKLGGK